MTVYRTAPPVLDRAGGTLPLRLTGVVRRVVGPGTCATDDPALHRYYADLAALHGIGHRGDVLAAGGGNTFAALADAALAGLVSPVRPVDLVVVASTLPDLDPRFSAGIRLTSTLPGAPLTFAVSGPDASIGFTALRIAGDYARRHSYARVVVLVLDQAVLPYETSAVPAGDAAVALLLEDARGGEVTTGTLAGVAPDAVAGALAALAPGARVVVADPADGAPGTGVWAGLASGADTGCTVLATRPSACGDLRYCVVRAP